MEATLALLNLIVGLAAVLGAAFFVGPAIARATFVNKMGSIRDEIDDAVYEGVLPEDVCVRKMQALADDMVRHGSSLSVSHALAVRRVFAERGLKIPDEPSYGNLTPEQRKLMHQFDARIVDIVAHRIVAGSTFAVFLRPALWIARKIPAPKGAASKTMQPCAREERLASTMVRVPDASFGHYLNGPSLQPS
jgi:hypothetical protein